MALNIQALYEQGRAKSPTELWSAEELEAVHTFVRERNIPRTSAADYVRNGIVTLEDYDKATKAKFVPVKLEDAVKAAADGLKDGVKKLKAKPKK